MNGRNIGRAFIFFEKEFLILLLRSNDLHGQLANDDVFGNPCDA
jgi:hypothetical protein